MCAQKHEDQGTITLSQMDYLPMVIESFLVDRKSQGLSGETVKFYKKKRIAYDTITERFGCITENLGYCFRQD